MVMFDRWIDCTFFVFLDTAKPDIIDIIDENISCLAISNNYNSYSCPVIWFCLLKELGVGHARGCR
jgi:hypothetical protein